MEFNENKPIYLQLADQIMDEVERAGHVPGGRLPSVREYAAGCGVNANTAMRTYTWLQQEGIIFNKRGIGFYYADDADKRVLEMRRKQFFEKDMPYFIDRMNALGISLDEFNKIFGNYK